MSIKFNHAIVAARDRHLSAAFFTHLFGLLEPTAWGPFVSVRLDEDVFLQFAEPGIESHHAVRAFAVRREAELASLFSFPKTASQSRPLASSPNTCT